MDQIETAVDAKIKGLNCAQSILSAYAADFQLDPQAALRLASALGGGLACRGETCGAVTGALMVIGLQHANADPEDRATRDEVYGLGAQFMQEFANRQGSTGCRELLGCDISLPEGLQFARDNGLFDLFCAGYVRTAAEILAEMQTDGK